MNVMDRLFGRKARTPDTIGATLTAARDRLTSAQVRATAAADRRRAAIASGDRSDAIDAEAEQSAAGIDAEIAADEIAGLETGLADAVRTAEAEARAALVASLVARRNALGARFKADWPEAAAVLAGILSETATLARDISEVKAEREVERLPEVSRGLPMHGEAMSTVSAWLGDALAAPPMISESPKERELGEYHANADRRRAERKAESDRQFEEGRERLRATRDAERQAEADRERNPYYGGWRDVLDAAR